MAKLRRKNICQVTERDCRIFKYLWTWKRLSTSALARKFFPECKPRSAWQKLRRLENAGYIETTRSDQRCEKIWGLTKKGFEVVRSILGELESKVYDSENSYHDFLATAFHLGEWLTHQPLHTQNYSEQQLRCLPIDAAPSWIPPSTRHRPDGYSVIQSNNQNFVVAFECEISIKAKQRYESVVAYYDNAESVNAVLWLVNTPGTMKSLVRFFTTFHIRNRNKHHFVLLEDFKRLGWMAVLKGGVLNGKTIQEVMIPQGVDCSYHARCTVDIDALLNTRKSPIHSSSSDPI